LFGLGRWFGVLFHKGAADRHAGLASIYVRTAALTERLQADPHEVRVLHGAIHHYNIRQSARGWLAFDPKGFLVGERTYDCANTLCNPARSDLVHNETWLLTQAGILSDTLAIARPRVFAFTYAYACLNASWWVRRGDGDEHVQSSLKVARIIEPHLTPL
jgi:streptomycin 6-kinase